MSDYKSQQKVRWDSLAAEFGGTNPLRAVISADSDLVNDYFDKTTKGMLRATVELAGRKVLDLGCGVGRLCAWAATTAGQVTGVDISAQMIKVAESQAAAEGLRNVDFKVYEGVVLPFADEQFDVIVCCGVLKYVIDDGDLEKLFGEMTRVLVRGGHMAIIDQFDYLGPVALQGSDDLGQASILRHPSEYIGALRQHGMDLVGQYSLYRRRASNLIRRVLGRLHLVGALDAHPRIGQKMVDADVLMDQLMRRELGSKRGFQLLHLRRSS